MQTGFLDYWLDCRETMRRCVLVQLISHKIWSRPDRRLDAEKNIRDPD